MIILGIACGVRLLLLFNKTYYFSIPLALVTLGAIFIGLLLSITALILHALRRNANRKS